MAAGVEDGVEIIGLDAVEARRRSELRLRGAVGFPPMGEIGLETRLVALRIERRLATLRRGEHDLDASRRERVVRRGELLEPEARLAAGVAEPVVRGEDHQDLHARLRSS